MVGLGRIDQASRRSGAACLSSSQLAAWTSAAPRLQPKKHQNLLAMCPLRYILLLLSLLVAMIGLSQAMTEPEMSALTQDGEDEKSGSGKAGGKKTTLRTLVDMLNGKYLYDAWKLSRGTQIKAE
ncbi:hypothetical protein BBJ28_00009343 [Nothophytophthora sp. Chile5]|nr:hypothetical protein BBJ28_00009343 [Nothophytophthora sp. Chile5]